MRKWALGIVAAIAVVMAVSLYTLQEDPPPPLQDEAITLSATASVGDPPAGENSALEATDQPKSVIAPNYNGLLRGRILQPDGKPASGAEVDYTWRASERQPPLEDDDALASLSTGRALTDGEGLFEFASLPRGEFTLSAIHETGRAAERIRLTPQRPLEEVTLVLLGGESLGGIVVGRDGQGIAGARVMPLALHGARYFGYESEARAVTTNDAGGFRIDSLDAGEWTLHASAEGYGSAVTGPLPVGIDNARIVLSKGATLAVRVLLLEDDTPAAGATVTLAYRDEKLDPARAVSDESGVASFSDVGAGDYLADLADTRYALAGPPESVTVDPSRKQEPLTLYVTAGGEIRGRLSDGATGAGIPGMVLRAWQKDRNRLFFSSPTDADGAYAFAGMPPGAYTVKPPERMPGYPQDPLEKPQEAVTLSPGQIVNGVDFTMEAGAALAGIVLDGSGNPVEGAMVRANAEEGRQNLAEFFTAADGRFQFGDYAEGESVYLVAETPSTRSGRVGPFVAGASGSDAIELRLSLDCGGIIAGRVVDRRGQPFACKVMALSEEEALQFPVMWPTGETDGAGNFVLPEVCVGTYALHLVPRSNSRQIARTVTVKPGEAVLGLALVYDQGELLDLSGTVQDSEGVAVAGARVSASFVDGQRRTPGGSVVADENGVFVFAGLPEGAYEIGARADGFSGSEGVLAHAGDEGVVIEMIRAPRVSGAVTGAGGASVTAFSLTLMDAGGVQRAPAVHRIADEEGRFSVTVPDQGYWNLRVEAEGYVPAEIDLGRVGAEEDVAGIAVTLGREP